MVDSNVLTPFSGLRYPDRKEVVWDGKSTGHRDPAEDYKEAGIWTFSDGSNLASSSTYTFLTGAGGGKCVANARKGSTPTPVAAPAECGRTTAT